MVVYMNTTKKLLLVSVLLAMSLTGCKAKEEAKPAQEAVDPNIVQLTPLLENEVKLVTASMSDVREVLRIPGSIQVDEQRMARIGASVTGRITDINVILGQEVKQGQVLATLNSTELGQNQLLFIKAQQQISLQSRAVERAKLLLES